MTVSRLDNVLWAAGFIGHVALVVVLWTKGRRREFPIFTALIAFQALVTIALFLIYRYGSQSGYRRVYWTTAAIDFAFQLGLIYEIMQGVLRPAGTWARDARKNVLLWSGLAVLVAFGAAATIATNQGSMLSKLEVRGTIFTSLLTCELFLAMLMTANRLGLQWRSHVMALGQGLTVWALVALIGDMAHVILGWTREFVVLDWIREVFYLGALVYWIVAFWLPERSRRPISSEMERYLIAVHQDVRYDLERITAVKK